MERFPKVNRRANKNLMENSELEIRPCKSLEELDACVKLQKEVFALPDLEISPRRHLVVTISAGGFVLGAFTAAEKLVGFVLSVPGFAGGERFFYSHMTAVAADFQSLGIGAKLKWAQREKALQENVKFIKWTFQPFQARNAFFNLEKLGAVIKSYAPNFYGTDYSADKIGLDSDRLFAEWDLEDEKVVAFSKGEKFTEKADAAATIEISNDWDDLVKRNPEKAIAEQQRVKNEFQKAFAENLICRSFHRDDAKPKYLLYAE